MSLTQTFQRQRDIVILFAVALLLRILYWIFLRQHYFFYDHPGADVLYYREWSWNIARGDWIGHDTFWGLPLYPYFLAVLERLSLGNMFFVRLVHLMLGSLNCVLTYLIGRALFSKEIGLLAGALMAANFTLIHYDWLLMPVTVIITLSLIAALAFLNQDRILTRHEWGILGFLLGLAALGDGKFLIVIFLTILYWFRLSHGVSGQFLKTKLFPLLLGFFLVVGTTAVRNKLVGGDWIWISAQNGLSLYVGNNPQATGVYENPAFIRPTHAGQDEDQTIVAEALAKRRLTPAEVVQFWRHQAFDFIKNQHWDYVRLLGRKFSLFFTQTEYAYDMDLLLQRDWQRRFDWNPFWLICPLALLGLFLARQKPGVVYLNIFILSQLLFTLVFFLTDRHRATILPFLILYESSAIFWFIGQFHSRNLKPALWALGCLALFIFILRPQRMPEEHIEFYRAAKTAAVYEQKMDLAKAHEQYSRALELRPTDTNTMFNLANVYAANGQWDAAQAYYEKILILNAYHVDALYNLGFVQERQGALAQSFATFQQLFKLQPKSPDVLFELGQVAKKLGDCTGARNYFEQLIAVKPNFVQILQSEIESCRPLDSST